MIYFQSLFLSLTSLNSFQQKTLAVFLIPYFKGNGFSLPLNTMTSTYKEKKLPFLIFSGLPNLFLLVWLFIYYLILVLIPTALLICTENSFWYRYGDFEKSFSFYVESGMMEMVEKDIDILRNEQSEFLVTKDFQARFHKFIVEHYLCKFYCFYLHLTYLTTFFT